MSEKEDPKQRTDRGHEIPVPKRSTWDRLLRKVSHPKPPNGEQKDKPASE